MVHPFTWSVIIGGFKLGGVALVSAFGAWLAAEAANAAKDLWMAYTGLQAVQLSSQARQLTWAKWFVRVGSGGNDATEGDEAEHSSALKEPSACWQPFIEVGKLRYLDGLVHAFSI
eukprot:555787-Amphidinium_carterae.1